MGTYQFSGRRDDERSEAVLRSPAFPEEHLEDRDQEGERLSASGPCGAEHVLALEGERHCSLLDVGHARVVRRLETGEGLLRQRQIAELFGARAILAVVAQVSTILALLVRPWSAEREEGDVRIRRPPVAAPRALSVRAPSSDRG